MHPSSSPAGLSAGQNELQGPSCPESQSVQRSVDAQAKAGLNAEPKAPEKGRIPRGGAMSAPHLDRPTLEAARRDLRAAGLLPDERHYVPGPDGHDVPATSARRVQRHDEANGHLYEGGWHVVSIKGGDEDGGVTSHRGVLHPDEYVDPDVLRALVERELGFTYEQVRSVYRQGPLSADARELRGHIDARLLALSRSGSHMAELGQALGFPVKDDGHCRVMENALARAREEEA